MSAKKQTYQINGRVIDEKSKRGIAGLRVEVWDQDLIFNDLVGSAVTDANGAFRIEFTTSYFRELFEDRKPDLFFKVFSGSKLVKSTEDSVMWNVAAGSIPVEITVRWAGRQIGDDGLYNVSGTVTSPDRPGVRGLRVEIIDRNIGQNISLAETATDDGGHYEASFSAALLHNKSQPDLQAKVFAGDELLAASDVRYNATAQEIINISLPANSSGLASEYETLTRALRSKFDGQLRDLKESNEQEDISYLAKKTGWDARAVALAALADKFSQNQIGTDQGRDRIAPAFYYALFRAGLPANPDTLYHATPQTVQRVWEQAIAQGVIPEKMKLEIGEAVEAFRRLSTEKLLTGPPMAGASPLKELLAASRLDELQQRKFADLYTTHQSDLPKFWEAITAEFGAETSRQLQVDGKLGFLTINNAPLVQKLRALPGDAPLGDPIELAQNGFHRAARWTQLLADDVPVPKEIPGETADEKKQNYAEYLAAQIRLSYPTASVAEMVRSGEMPINARDQVSQFLTNHREFEIGLHPIQQYIARHKLDVPEETVTQVKRLQRVYQLTPSDEAAAGLLRNNIDAAYQVVSYDKEEFVNNFSRSLGSPEAASMTYDRSSFVHGALLNLTMSYVTARNGISMGSTRQDGPELGIFGGMMIDPQPKGPSPETADDVIAYATLEDLFGEMDFCACDHCRSILSPAAYLVDLLYFINKGAGDANPLNVFLKRRPDVEHLPLTCENTNTALPYIDVVNETLEYFVANSSMVGYLGHDTDDMMSEDLLASPQFVNDAAYLTLQNEAFPSPLPFHRPLETLRRYFEKFEVPLKQAMERLRHNNDLERNANTYGWRDILMEELGLSRAEYDILTNTAAVSLARMYGFPAGDSNASVAATLSKAKDFTRRVGITYDDIVEILKTRFVNPNSDLVPKLDRLSVSFATIKAFKNGNITGAQFDNRLPQGAGAPDPANYGGNIRDWVTLPENFDRIMRIITLTDTEGNDDPCSFDTLEFRYSEPMANLADTSTRLGTAEFVRLMRFIRLWKKLGWTIEQTDAAICALFPEPPLEETDVNTRAKLNNGFLTLLPRLGIVLRVMKSLNLSAKRDLLSLLACWAPIGTHGAHQHQSPPNTTHQHQTPLYRQMFLHPAMQAQDDTFDDNGYGEFLQDNRQKVLGHSEALRAAFGLTNDEFSQILEALGFDADFVEVPFNHGQPNLEQPILDTAPGIAYDAVNQRLSFTGALSDATRVELRDLPGVSAAFQTAVDALYAANQAVLTTLTLDHISAIYRHGWLARKMKLSVREFLLLIKLTGLNPFATPSLTNPDVVNLIDLAQAMKERSLNSSAALYLIWNQDLSGKSAPDPAQVMEFARSLRGDFAGIEEQFAAVEDPGGEIARARMTLVYGVESTNAFFALLDETQALDVAYTHPQSTLENEITALDRQIAYDGFRHRLSHTGLLSAAMRDQLKLIPAIPAPFAVAVDALFARSEDARGSFFGRYPELKPLFENAQGLDQTLVLVVDYTHPANDLEAEIKAADARIAYDDPTHRLSYSGVLTPTRQDTLKGVPGVSAEFTAAVDALFLLSQEAKGKVLAALQPELSHRRKRQQALQRFSTAATLDMNSTQTLLDPSVAPYPLHASAQPNRPALDDVLALETPGLAAEFFFRDTATGVVDLSVPSVAKLDYAAGGDNPPPVNPAPGAPISGIWRGHLETPEAGFYNFVIETDAVTVNLNLGGQARAMIPNGNVWRNNDPLELKGNTLYEVVLTVDGFRDSLSVKWETPKRPREVIPRRHLYPSAVFAPFIATYTRFLKVVSLGQGLRLSANELTHFATDANYQVDGDGWLNALATAGDPPAAVSAALFKPLRDLLHFARIKAALSANDESLLTILQDPAAATADSAGLLYTLTRWDAKSLDDLLFHFNSTIADLSQFPRFRFVYDAFALIQRMGISAGALISATTNEPTANTVRDLQAALRARYETVDWRTLVQPINDTLRALQRDALVAYILHLMRSNPVTAHIDTADKLFEYFLMDVEMEPCMQTSRIRHALSSVQLFIERCLMNLEPDVPSSSIIAKRWDWMKRYRVWEANRKVFLYPENWLEPELRDDKSSFFKEIESQLLQSDVTEEVAAKALLNYLSKLEEVAELEPCGIYHIEPTVQTGEIDHVIARTSGANRKYFYRRREYGYWTPWEKIDLEIEENPIIPVVWNDRLLLFWLKIMKQGSEGNKPPAGNNVTSLRTEDLPGNPDLRVQAVLCWSEYYNGKWQPMKTSDVEEPTECGWFSLSGYFVFQRGKIKMASAVEGDPETAEGDALRVRFSGSGGSSFLLYNTHSLPVRAEDEELSADDEILFLPGPEVRVLDRSGSPLVARYWAAGTPWEYGIPIPTHSFPILENALRDYTLEPHNQLQNAWEAPFFYGDRRHVFFVTTKEHQPPFYLLDDFGVMVAVEAEDATLPGLVVGEMPEEERPGPKLWGDGDPVGPDGGVINPNPMRKLISEDADILYGIGSTATVDYEGTRIGPQGVIRDTSRKI